MTLPTIIIAGRAALKAVPPSIREAALGSRRVAGPGGHPPRLAAGDARHADRHDHRHGPGPGRDGAAADDRHGRLHRRHPAGVTDPATVLPVQIYPVGRHAPSAPSSRRRAARRSSCCWPSWWLMNARRCCCARSSSAAGRRDRSMSTARMNGPQPVVSPPGRSVDDEDREPPGGLDRGERAGAERQSRVYLRRHPRRLQGRRPRHPARTR